MIVIAGLGNPGEKYSKTRHNIGFMITGKLAQKHAITGKSESKFNAVVGKGTIFAQPVMIVQPTTFMNLSGEAIFKILNFYKLEPKDLFVIFDDISLDLGKVRFRDKGSDGGHNGIKSIIKNLGNKNDFARLKVGIGPQPKGIPSETYVLQKFSESEEKMLPQVIDLSVDAIEDYLKNGIEFAQNKFNGVDLTLG